MNDMFTMTDCQSSYIITKIQSLLTVFYMDSYFFARSILTVPSTLSENQRERTDTMNIIDAGDSLELW